MAEVSRIGKRLKYYRKARGLTQIQLKEASGVGLGVIGGLESGQRDNITVATLERLARTLGVTLDALAGFDPLRDDDTENEPELAPART